MNYGKSVVEFHPPPLIHQPKGDENSEPPHMVESGDVYGQTKPED